MFKVIKISALLLATMFIVACSSIDSDAKSVVEAMFDNSPEKFQEGKSLHRKFLKKYSSNKEDSIAYLKAYAKWYSIYEKEKQSIKKPLSY